MAISYPRSYINTTDFKSVTLSFQSAVAKKASPFSYHTYVQSHVGRRWMLDVALVPSARSTADQWISWLESLEGGLYTFLGGNPAADVAKGTAATNPGTPLVNGASQTGSSLIIDGCPTSETGWLLAGDFVQVGTGASSELYRVLEDVTTDGSGNATLSLNRDLLNSPSNNAAVAVSSCRGVFRLADTTVRPVLNTTTYAIQFKAIEDIS